MRQRLRVSRYAKYQPGDRVEIDRVDMKGYKPIRRGVERGRVIGRSPYFLRVELDSGEVVMRHERNARKVEK